MQLRIPGPTPCNPKVLQAAGRQMIDHRGKEFGEIFEKLASKVKKVYQTTGDVLILTSSGTGAMEAAVVNTLSPGDKVLATSCGFFGDRFAEIAQIYGANVIKLSFEMGNFVDPDAVRKALKENPGVKAVLMTHNESSTGITNDVKSIAEAAREVGALSIVDSVSGIGSINLPVDEWQLDAVASASQKGWMSPPGLGMVSMSSKAWEANKTAKMPRNYFNLAKAKQFLVEKKQTPWTPAVSTIFAVDAAVDLILEEGLTNVFARHARCAKVAREGVKALGFSLLADEKHASYTVTAVKAAAGMDVTKFCSVLRDEFGVVIAGGQGTLTGKIFRIGHLGWVNETDMNEVLAALPKALPKSIVK